MAALDTKKVGTCLPVDASRNTTVRHNYQVITPKRGWLEKIKNTNKIQY